MPTHTKAELKPRITVSVESIEALLRRMDDLQAQRDVAERNLRRVDTLLTMFDTVPNKMGVSMEHCPALEEIHRELHKARHGSEDVPEREP